MRVTLRSSTWRFAAFVVGSVLVAGCVDRGLTPPTSFEPMFAKGGGGGGGPTVERTDPSSAPQDVTLDVRVLGTNFAPGANASFLLDGKATEKVRTNATAFVSSTELVANITIAPDAVVDLYDVQVTPTSGKPGIGIELFEVTGPTADLANFTAGAGPGLYEDGLGIYFGELGLTGQSPSPNYTVSALCNESRLMDLRLPSAWSTRGAAANCRGENGRFVRFHVPDLKSANCADGAFCPIGGLPVGPNYSPSVYYYFTVDANGDGTYGWPNGRHRDDPYAFNVVWTDAVFSVQRRGSDGTTACTYHVTAGIANFYQRDDILISPTGQAVALDVVIARDDGVCGP